MGREPHPVHCFRRRILLLPVVNPRSPMLLWCRAPPLLSGLELCYRGMACPPRRCLSSLSGAGQAWLYPTHGHPPDEMTSLVGAVKPNTLTQGPGVQTRATFARTNPQLARSEYRRQVSYPQLYPRAGHRRHQPQPPLTHRSLSKKLYNATASVAISCAT